MSATLSGSDRAAVGFPCLILPGLCCSGSGHWQSLWESQRANCSRVDLGHWEDPKLDDWLSRLDHAIFASAKPPVLVAHSLGCLAVVWWARRITRKARSAVAGAMLVAPPDVDGADDPRLRRFAPAPAHPLPFPTLVVASRNDPYAAFNRSAEMAQNWGAELIDLGKAGHINDQSELGVWPYGQRLLDRMIGAKADRARSPGDRRRVGSA